MTIEPQPLTFKNLRYEASERNYWAEDDHRWGTIYTTWLGFWLLSFFGRFRDATIGKRVIQ
jgi:hypothetical protein